MKKRITLYMLLTAVLLSSCSEWLDIQPSDRVSEENNFADVAGFKKALNGVYIELNQPGLYGQSLTCEFVEILAQRYAIGDENKDNLEVMRFQYGGSYVQAKVSQIWSTAYSLIANLNLILKNCELHREILPEEYYHLVKGEALALRAYLHFDLFRLFGPIYSIDSESLSLPYYTEQSFDVAPTRVASEFMQMVLKDLTDAEKELENDPVVKYGIKGNNKDSFLQHRNLRLNYYAVQALMARAYLYIGDKENAYDYATKVITVHEEKFPWVSPRVLTMGNNMDRVFSSEILFGLQNLERSNIFRDLFDGQNLKLNTLLAPRADIVDEVFGGDKNDYRRVSALEKEVEISGKNYCVFNKYAGSDSLYNQMIPMLRISEMYLIAVEAAEEDDVRTAYFNTFLNHRGLRSVQVWDVEYYFPKEWKKEFYGEGQLFFYYKRNNMEYIQSGAGAYPWDEINMRPENYVLPIPEGESKYN